MQNYGLFLNKKYNSRLNIILARTPRPVLCADIIKSFAINRLKYLIFNDRGRKSESKRPRFKRIRFSQKTRIFITFAGG